MRVLVCGGRTFTDYAWLCRVLDDLHIRRQIELVIVGGAQGADTLAEAWARRAAVPHLVFPAKWREHGRAAGVMRNAEMLALGRPTLVVAFPGNKGTADMVRRAEKAGVVVMRAAAET